MSRAGRPAAGRATGGAAKARWVIVASCLAPVSVPALAEVQPQREPHPAAAVQAADVASSAAPSAAAWTRPGFTRLDAPGGPYDVEWQLPADAAVRPGAVPIWVLLQHGFARSCANLRGTAQALASRGFATFCINADMAAGAPALARSLAATLLAGGEQAWTSPDGVPALPPRWVLGGHSAGALFAAQVGAALVAAAPQRVAGALLLDPVGGRALSDALLAVSAGGQRPVRAVLAAPSGCNARHLALPALLAVQAAASGAAAAEPAQASTAAPAASSAVPASPARPSAAGSMAAPTRVGVHLLGRSTHLDAEGEDTEAVAVWACREGRPDPAQTQVLRDLAAAWVAMMVAGAPAEPGASSAAAPAADPPLVDALLASGRARLIGPGADAAGPPAALHTPPAIARAQSGTRPGPL